MRLFLQHAFWGPVWLGLAFAQSPSFEAASAKPAAAPSGRASMHGGPGTADPAQVTFTNATLMNVLLRAYDVQSFQVTGPDWLATERYDIAAKIPPGTAPEQFRAMLQKLLAERFHLALHRETRQLQGFELTVARGGPKLKASADAGAGDSAQPETPPKLDANGFPILTQPGVAMMEGVRGKAVVTFLTARAQPISALAGRISREFRMPILDKTGLGGAYDFTLEFAPQPPGAPPAAPPAEGVPAGDDSGPNLLSAVQRQLGLRLTPSKIPVEMLIVDRAERVPSGN